MRSGKKGDGEEWKAQSFAQSHYLAGASESEATPLGKGRVKLAGEVSKGAQIVLFVSLSPFNPSQCTA